MHLIRTLKHLNDKVHDLVPVRHPEYAAPLMTSHQGSIANRLFNLRDADLRREPRTEEDAGISQIFNQPVLYLNMVVDYGILPTRIRAVVISVRINFPDIKQFFMKVKINLKMGWDIRYSAIQQYLQTLFICSHLISLLIPCFKNGTDVFRSGTGAEFALGDAAAVFP